MKTTVRADPQPLAIDPTETAVIVVDMQNDFLSEDGMFGRAGLDIAPGRAVIEPTASVLDAARRAGMTIVYLKMEFEADLSNAGGPEAPNLVRHLALGVGQTVDAPDASNSRVLIKDTWNTEIVPELAPQSHDVVMSKHRYSGFFETELDAVLKAHRISNLIFTGVTTSVCVESTLRDAFFRDYKCLLLRDCTAEPIGNDLARTNHEASLLVIQMLFGWVTDSAALLQALQVAPITAPQ
ncbi:MAG TPA: cysteine hydrolase [Dehalococcoidia bacterium]|nr:cysteine hydrolase [Dehalococcoidia bacterium]